MMPIKTLCRLARRLQRAWPGHATDPSANTGIGMRAIQTRFQALQQTARRLEKAQGRHLTLILPQLHDDLRHRLLALQSILRDEGEELKAPVPTVPGLVDLLSELQQLEADFGALDIDWKEQHFGVSTRRITLRDIDLGPFAMRLCWSRLEHLDSGCFDIVALDPNPAAANADVTHPHVRDGKLCPGAALMPLRRALTAGRLADAFHLVHGVLGQYNPHSPHVSLDDWEGSECADCGCRMSEAEIYACSCCGQDFCDYCSTYCTACSSVRCNDCMTPCAACGECYCSGCLRPSALSGRQYCRGCLVTCTACGRSVGTDERCSRTNHCSNCQNVDPATGSSADAISSI